MQWSSCQSIPKVPSKTSYAVVQLPESTKRSVKAFLCSGPVARVFQTFRQRLPMQWSSCQSLPNVPSKPSYAVVQLPESTKRSVKAFLCSGPVARVCQTFRQRLPMQWSSCQSIPKVPSKTSYAVVQLPESTKSSVKDFLCSGPVARVYQKFRQRLPMQWSSCQSIPKVPSKTSYAVVQLPESTKSSVKDFLCSGPVARVYQKFRQRLPMQWSSCQSLPNVPSKPSYAVVQLPESTKRSVKDFLCSGPVARVYQKFRQRLPMQWSSCQSLPKVPSDFLCSGPVARVYQKCRQRLPMQWSSCQSLPKVPSKISYAVVQLPESTKRSVKDFLCSGPVARVSRKFRQSLSMQWSSCQSLPKVPSKTSYAVVQLPESTKSVVKDFLCSGPVARVYQTFCQRLPMQWSSCQSLPKVSSKTSYAVVQLPESTKRSVKDFLCSGPVARVYQKCRQRLPMQWSSCQSLPKVSSKTSYAVVQLPESTKSVIKDFLCSGPVARVYQKFRQRLPMQWSSCQILPKVSSKTSYAVVQLPESTKRSVKDFLCSGPVARVYQKCRQRLPMQWSSCQSLPNVLSKTSYAVVQLPVYQKFRQSLPMQWSSCQSLPNVPSKPSYAVVQLPESTKCSVKAFLCSGPVARVYQTFHQSLPVQ